MSEEENSAQANSENTDKLPIKKHAVYDPLGKVESISHAETKVLDIHQHLFGLIVLYFQATVGLVLSLGIILIFLDSVLETIGYDQSSTRAITYFMALIAILVGLIFMIIVARIYNANKLIVTDENITQVTQRGLFNRKVSELSMANVEDVTAQQHGVFATMFNFGTLKIETAGEQNNFQFSYCPNPNAYAKAALDAKSLYIKHHGTRH